MTKKTATASKTMIVANPRRMWFASRLTAGSIAIDANHPIRTVKMTEPPSSMTKFSMRVIASSAITTHPTRQMFCG